MKKQKYLVFSMLVALGLLGVVYTKTTVEETYASLTSVSIVEPAGSITIAAGADPYVEASYVVDVPNGDVVCNWDMDDDGAYDDLVDSCGPTQYTFNDVGTFNIQVQALDDDLTPVTSGAVQVEVVDAIDPVHEAVTNTEYNNNNPSEPPRPYVGTGGEIFHYTNDPADPDTEGVKMRVDYGALGGIDPYVCDWDFDEGSGFETVSGGCNPIWYKYETPGTYEVHVRVYDDSDTTPAHYQETTTPITVVVGDPLSVTMSPDIDQNIAEGETVDFEATPAGGFGTYVCDWDTDGDGSFDDILDDCNPPAYTYSTQGVNTNVKVRVSDDTVDDDTNPLTAESAGIDVTVNANMLAGLSPNTNQEVLVDEVINFTATPSDGTSPYTCYWDLDGDGSFDDATDPECDDTQQVSFDTAGDYLGVGVQVTDSADPPNVTIETIDVTVNDPLSVLMTPGSETVILVNDSVDFQATPDGGIAPHVCDWDLDGDGSFDDEIDNCDPAALQYTTAEGPLTVGVQVTDSDSPADVETATIQLTINDPLSATMTPDTNQTLTAGDTIDFVAVPAGGVPTYTCNWDMNGDGTFDEVTNNCDPDAYSFDTVSDLTDVGVEITDSDTPATVITRAIDVTVNPAPLSVEMTPNTNQTIGAGGAIDFSAVTAGGVAGYICDWDMDGDGAYDEVTDDCTPGLYTFNSEGTFTGVGVQVTDSDAPASTVTAGITVEVVPMFVEIIEPSAPRTIVQGEGIDFEANVSGGIAPLTYEWWFENDDQTPDTLADSTTENPSIYTYSSTGSYYGCVRVTDDDTPANTSTDCVQIVVNPPIQVTMTTTYEIYDGDTISFSAPVVTGGIGSYSYSWDFDGDSFEDSTETAPTSPAYAYQELAFVGRLTVSDSATPPHMKQKSFTVTVYEDIDFAGIQTAEKINDTTVRVSWNAATGGKSPYLYSVYQSNQSGGFNFGGTTACSPTTLTQCDITGLTDGTYYFAVRAEDDMGTSDTNTQEQSVTIGVPDDLQPPTNITAEATDDEIDLDWDSGEGNVVAYKVYYAESSNSSSAETVTVSDTSITLDGLNDNDEYFIRITSIDAESNESDFSVEFQVNTLDDEEESFAVMDNGFWLEWVVSEESLTGNFNFEDYDDKPNNEVEIKFYDEQLILTLTEDFIDDLEGETDDEAELFIDQNEIDDMPGRGNLPDGFVLRGEYGYDITIEDDEDDDLTEFGEHLEIEFEFDDSDVENSSNLYVYYYDAEDNEWIEEESGDISGDTVTLEPDHLTAFAVLEEVGDEADNDDDDITGDDLDNDQDDDDTQSGDEIVSGDLGTTSGELSMTFGDEDMSGEGSADTSGEEGATGSEGDDSEGGMVLGDTTLTQSGAGVFALLFLLSLVITVLVKRPFFTKQ